MFRFRKHALAATFSIFALGSSISLAQGLPKDGPLADGELSQKELAVVLATAQRQLVKLSDAAVGDYESVIRDPEPNMPAAWMLMKDGETIKRLNIDDQVGEIPASTRIVLYRSAIKSIARRGEINAAVILYTGRTSEDSDSEALVIEHEHRLGVSANKVIGYEVQGGNISWSQPVTTEKSFELFYDKKEKDV